MWNSNELTVLLGRVSEINSPFDMISSRSKRLVILSRVSVSDGIKLGDRQPTESPHISSMCGLLLGRRNSCEELSALEFVQMEVSANDISEYEILDCRNFRTKEHSL